MLVLKFILQYIADIVTQGIMEIFLSIVQEMLLQKAFTICMANQEWIHAGVDPGFYMSDLHQLN